jgi:hypothetical protein
MARNLGREFATMTDDERRRFELKQRATGEMPEEQAADELDMEDPRDSEPMGSRFATPSDELADPDARDGEAALLDDEAHARGVEAERKSRRGTGDRHRR